MERTSLTAGMAVGGAATGLLANAAPRAPFAIAVAAMAIAALWTLQLCRPSQPQRGIAAPAGTTESVGE